MTPSELTELVGSRICHDLANPLGAVGNGVELLGMTNGASAEMDLVTGALSNAAARLNFFRIAFGAASADQTMGAGAIRAILDGLNNGGRHQITWVSDDDMNRLNIRALFLAVLCAETALPLGGTVMVTPDLRVEGTGRRVEITPELWDPMLSGDIPTALIGGNVQFGLIVRALHEAGLTPQLSHSADQLCLSLTA